MIRRLRSPRPTPGSYALTSQGRTQTTLLALTFAAASLSACTPHPTPSPPEPAAAPAPAAPITATEPVVAAAPPAEDEHCKCPAEPLPAEPSDESDNDDDPHAAKIRRARALKKLPKPLALRLSRDLPEHRAACDVILAGPCTIGGDFDGDRLADDAVLVRNGEDQGGIAILWGKGGAELLGAGRHQCWAATEVADLDGTPPPAPCLEPIAADLAWLARWEPLTRIVEADTPELRRPSTPPARRGHPAPGALGDALLIDGGDAAAALYRTSSGWTLMHLGY